MRLAWRIAVLLAGCGAARAEGVTGLLAPADTLDPDVVAAARFEAGDSGLDYIGAWASLAEECPLVDLDYDYEFLVVVTPDQVHRFASTCLYDAAPLVAGKVSVPAICAHEGYAGMKPAAVEFSIPDADHLVVDGGETLVRCVLPE